MTTAVLFDGAPSAVRALEYAMVPGFLVDHAAQQLIILHAWRDHRDPTQLAAAAQPVDIIAKSRIAQATLNYKIELLRLPTVAEAPTAAPVAAPTPTLGKSATAAATATAPAPPAVPAAGAAAAPAAAAVTDAAAAAGHSPTAGAMLATALNDYLTSRIAHHEIDNVIAGVGNNTHGKGIAVGGVTRMLLAHQRSKHVKRLLLVKATGPAVRPTAPLRMLVLVFPGLPLDHLYDALALAKVEQRQDRVGCVVVGNNGQAKPVADVMSLAAAMGGSPSGGGAPPAESADVGGAETARKVLAILAEHGLVDAPPVDASLLATASSGAGGAPSGGAAAPASVASETFPLVSTFFIEPTHSNPTPFVDDVPAQLVKFLAGLKADFLVLPPRGPRGECGDGLVNTLLATPKPHLMFL